MRTLLAALAVFMLLSCGVDDASVGAWAPADDQTGSAALSLPQQTIDFRGDYTQRPSAALLAGAKVLFTYDASRLPDCRAEQNGLPQWAITAFWRLNGGPIGSVAVAGLTNGPVQPITLDAGGELEVWFQATNRFGCSAWDSNYGGNYHFAVAASAPTVHFKANWSVLAEGLPSADARALVVDYPLSRLPNCRQTYNGAPTWEVLVGYRFDDGPANTTPVTRAVGLGRVASPAVLTVPEGARQVQLWFQNTDRAGCTGWDSNYGRNFSFTLR